MLVKRTFISLMVILSSCWLSGSAAVSGEVSSASLQTPGTERENHKGILKVTLKECIDIAIKNNHQRPVSQFALEAAEAQHKQALSAYWPQVSARAVYTTLDDDPNFIFPAKTIPVPSQTITIPANAFGPGFPPFPVPLNTPAGRFQVPEQDIKLMDKRNLITSLNVNYPLFTGGLRSAKVKQAKCGVEVAKQEVRRTDLQVMYDVHRMYYGVILARQLHQIGRDALARLEVTQELTEKLYKGGSLKVKKTDYLRSKSTVEGVRSLVAALESNLLGLRRPLSHQ